VVFFVTGIFPKKRAYLLVFFLATHVEQVDAEQHWFSGIPCGHLRVLFMFFVHFHMV
jgi:hypothetical protein